MRKDWVGWSMCIVSGFSLLSSRDARGCRSRSVGGERWADQGVTGCRLVPVAGGKGWGGKDVADAGINDEGWWAGCGDRWKVRSGNSLFFFRKEDVLRSELRELEEVWEGAPSTTREGKPYLFTKQGHFRCPGMAGPRHKSWCDRDRGTDRKGWHLYKWQSVGSCRNQWVNVSGWYFFPEMESERSR